MYLVSATSLHLSDNFCVSLILARIHLPGDLGNKGKGFLG
ncbi:rCG41220 [Rattus norvegicus]|uniref:RCG41220 n=1 Tax=Rattus norvegicus TaxID=10116 RepID=A6KMV5_RAT|nr:rCG41220 [Rattus norvegicus]